jgi:hypothetical protein
MGCSAIEEEQRTKEGDGKSAQNVNRKSYGIYHIGNWHIWDGIIKIFHK